MKRIIQVVQQTVSHSLIPNQLFQKTEGMIKTPITYQKPRIRLVEYPFVTKYLLRTTKKLKSLVSGQSCYSIIFRVSQSYLWSLIQVKLVAGYNGIPQVASVIGQFCSYCKVSLCVEGTKRNKVGSIQSETKMLKPVLE